jgi:hypothetical protein
MDVREKVDIGVKGIVAGRGELIDDDVGVGDFDHSIGRV